MAESFKTVILLVSMSSHGHDQLQGSLGNVFILGN